MNRDSRDTDRIPGSAITVILKSFATEGFPVRNDWHCNYIDNIDSNVTIATLIINRPMILRT